MDASLKKPERFKKKKYRVENMNKGRGEKRKRKEEPSRRGQYLRRGKKA